MDTKDFIIIGLSISLVVVVSVIVYLFFGKQQMNSTVPTNKEIRTYYSNGRNQPFLFSRSFSELGGVDGQDAIGREMCLGELPKRSFIRNTDGKIYKLLHSNNGTPEAVDGSFTARECKLGNKRPRPKDLDSTDNVTFLGKHYPDELVERDAIHAAVFGSDDEDE